MEDSRKAETIDVLFTTLARTKTWSPREKELVQDVSLPLELGKCLLSDINHPPEQLQNRAPCSAARPWSRATIWPRPAIPSLPPSPGSCYLPAHICTHHKPNNYTLPRPGLEVGGAPQAPLCPCTPRPGEARGRV